MTQTPYFLAIAKSNKNEFIVNRQTRKIMFIKHVYNREKNWKRNNGYTNFLGTGVNIERGLTEDDLMVELI